MYDLVQGKTLEEAMELDAVFHELMDSRGKGLDDERKNDLLEDAVVFQGASQYPMRIECRPLGMGRPEGFCCFRSGPDTQHPVERGLPSARSSLYGPCRNPGIWDRNR